MQSSACKPPGSTSKSPTKTNPPANDSNNNKEFLYFLNNTYNNKSINKLDYKDPPSPLEFCAKERPDATLILAQPKDK